MVAGNEQSVETVHCYIICEVCNAFQTKNQKETLISHEIPNRPWSKVGSDIFEWNKQHYLVLVYYYSDWIEFDLMKNQTACETINLMKNNLRDGEFLMRS